MEEKVVRMRQGYSAPDDMPLERVGQDNPALAAKLREIELRALEKSGRLEELRREAHAPIPSAGSPKAKIIASLRGKKPN